MSVSIQSSALFPTKQIPLTIEESFLTFFDYRTLALIKKVKRAWCQTVSQKMKSILVLNTRYIIILRPKQFLGIVLVNNKWDYSDLFIKPIEADIFQKCLDKLKQQHGALAAPQYSPPERYHSPSKYEVIKRENSGSRLSPPCKLTLTSRLVDLHDILEAY